ncbi:MAG: endolytic transglycosylase MltG, partial [Deltaproteobacteria bacterium]|nr:endolytic transglycosylase MltG [Deltaproteobacteria bacterium]
MRRFLLWAGIISLIILLATSGLAWYQVNLLLSPVSSNKKQVLVTIPKGATPGEMGRLLEEAKVIRSAKAFRYLVAWKKAGPRLRAGEHLLDPSFNTSEIIESLIKGRLKMHRLTLAEGLTMAQIAVMVSRAGLAGEDKLFSLFNNTEFIASLGLDVQSLEGYLFPETYYFTAGASASDIIRAMVDRFWEVWSRYEAQAQTTGMTRHEIVTLASIVEKETGDGSERPLIAAVFLNRLKKGMRLQSDPTVIYGLKDFDGNLTRRHLEAYTPYNTYQIKALPPGPIANPGEASLKAVLEPANVNYFYFVSKN